MEQTLVKFNQALRAIFAAKQRVLRALQPFKKFTLHILCKKFVATLALIEFGAYRERNRERTMENVVTTLVVHADKFVYLLAR